MRRLVPYFIFWGVLATLVVVLRPKAASILAGAKPHGSTANNKPCAGGGPPNYCANSTRDLVPETPMPSPPVNSPFRDPDFGSRMVRVTDANTMTAFGSGYYNNASFMTAASAEANVWGKFDPTLGTSGGYRFVITGDGNVQIPFMLDPTTMKVKKLGGKSGSFLNSHGRLDLTAPSFSYVHPDILFAANGAEIVAYNFSTNRKTRLYDFADCPGLPHSATQGSMYLGAITNSNDDTKFSYYLGGATQDETTLALYYDRSANNGAGACYWYNTQTGMTGGTNMAPAPVTPINSPQLPSTRAGGFTIHEVRINRDGSYVRVWPASIPRAPVLFWKPGTPQITACRFPYREDSCGGHIALGFSHLINDPGNNDEAEVLMRPLANLHAYTELIKPFPTPIQFGAGSHWSWNDDDSSDTMPVCGSFFPGTGRGNGTQNVLTSPVLQIKRAYDRETVCVATTGPSTVWRFAHNRATATMNDSLKAPSNFWATPRGNVSQDGKFYIFTSDWEWSLGSEQGASGCPAKGQCRTDVFIVELR